MPILPIHPTLATLVVNDTCINVQMHVFVQYVYSMY